MDDRAWWDRRYRRVTAPLLTPEEQAALDDFDSTLSRRIAFEKTMRHARRRISVLFWTRKRPWLLVRGAHQGR